MATIRNPIEWGADQFRRASSHAGSTGRALRGSQADAPAGPLTIRRIGVAELREILQKGVDDFAAYRTDVVFLCLIYPIIGLVLARLAFDHDFLPLLFPVASGFALLGPVAAIGLYEMSRRREQGVEASWSEAFGVIGAPAFGAIFVLGLLLLVIFLCLIYPIIGLVLARLAFDHDLLPLLFPVASGFALLGPVAAVGLYEMSRRREQGAEVRWSEAFGVIAAPAFGAIVVLGLVLLTIFLLWLVAAQVIYLNTLGPEPPASLAAFIGEVFGTEAGWTMIVVGVGVGFLFALLVLAISVVSFPLLLDRDVGLRTAITTSVRVAAANPVAIAAWGLIVAGGLVLGSLPLFLGLVLVLPVLGHATWHLYRRTVAH